MFNFFKKKSQLEALIEKDGIEHATDRFAEIVGRKLTSRDLAYQFILEELDGASGGNSASKNFAADSGILPAEYKGALKNSNPEVDGPDGPQLLLVGLCLELMDNEKLMAEFRCMTDDKIMRNFNLGKYSNRDERAQELLNSLKNIIVDDKDIIPAFTKDIPVPKSARVRQIYFHEKNMESAKNLIAELSEITGEGANTILRNALTMTP